MPLFVGFGICGGKVFTLSAWDCLVGRQISNIIIIVVDELKPCDVVDDDDADDDVDGDDDDCGRSVLCSCLVKICKLIVVNILLLREKR